jgi:hypothetical protein
LKFLKTKKEFLRNVSNKPLIIRVWIAPDEKT